MKSLSIVTTYSPRYWPLPIKKSIESTLENWPEHAEILVYPDDATQCMDDKRLQHYDLCEEQPILKDFIDRNKNNSTCIMKEIEISKFQSSITFPIPINKGVYYFEFGYRKKDGEWRKLAYQKLNLGYRIKKLLQSFDNDSWFDPKIRIKRNEVSFHEEAYQLSLNSAIGGSENIS